MLMEKIELEDGKYAVINENGRLRTFRHGEPWPGMDNYLVGMGFVLALVQEIEELRDKLRDIEEGI